MIPTVHIRKEALFIMIWSALETFKKECLGFVLGYRPTPKRNYFLVTDATSFTSMKKLLNTGVELTKRTDKRFKAFISLIHPIYPKYLGDFHSHSEWGKLKSPPEMSDRDLEQFKKYNWPLEFIIGISSRRKGQATWEILPDGGIKGSFNSFNFHINVFSLIEEGNEGIPQKLQIVAPTALEALNRILIRK